MTTKYPKQERTGRKGVDFVSHIANECGSIFRSFDTADVGIDGAIEFVNERDEPTGDLVLVQIKAGRSHIKGDRFVIQGDRDHFETWARYPVPIVGVVCDTDANSARWVDISEHLRHHPDRIAHGPYAIEAPSDQVFSVDSFGAFAKAFGRARVDSTSVDVSPNFLIRPWKPADTSPTRALLSAIAADYPDFDNWLEKQWSKAAVSKKVVELDRTVAAYSMWTKKDERNVKLQTFIVGQLFRGTAVGQHLLFHELRTWAEDPKIERVFVTVASSKVELIDYFEQFGFRVEGISANRYPRVSRAAELVLAKHFVREVIREPDDIERVFNALAVRVWGVDPAVETATRFGVASEHCSVPTQFPAISVRVDNRVSTSSVRVQLVDGQGDIVRHLDDASLMRQFFPLRLHLVNKGYAIVPIFAQWVRAMLGTARGLTSGSPTIQKLRVDNVYYCYPKLSRLVAGDLVVFYEPAKGGGSRSAIGCAVIREAVVDSPDVLFERFSERGVYSLADIRQHAAQGRAMAIHFEMFEPFGRPVTLDEIREILGNGTNIQGLTGITRDQFERLRLRGLSLGE